MKLVPLFCNIGNYPRKIKYFRLKFQITMQSFFARMRHEMHTNQIFIVYTLINFIIQFAYGANMNIIGAVLVDLRFIYNTSIDTMSFVPTVISLGYLVGSLTGWLYKWFNRQLTLTVIMTIFAVTIAMVPYCGFFSLLMVNSILNGIGCGAWDSSSSIWVVEMWPNSNSAVLQISQFMYGTGTIAGPMLASPFVRGEVNSTNSDITPDDRKRLLTYPFMVIAIIQFIAPVMFLILYCTKPYKKIDPPSNPPTNPINEQAENSSLSTNNSDSNLLNSPSGVVINASPEQQSSCSNIGPSIESIKNRTLKLSIVAMCIASYAASELNYFIFSPPMFQYLKGLDIPASEAAHLLSILSITFAFGRLLSAFISLRITPDTIIWYHFVIIFLSLTVIFVFGRTERYWLYPATFTLGYGFSAMWPALFAFTERHLRLTDRIGSIFSFICGGMGLITPVLLTNLFKKYPLILFLLTYIFLIISLALFIWVNVLIRRDRKQSIVLNRRKD